jgi:hypothetical protein
VVLRGKESFEPDASLAEDPEWEDDKADDCVTVHGSAFGDLEVLRVSLEWERLNFQTHLRSSLGLVASV